MSRKSIVVLLAGAIAVALGSTAGAAEKLAAPPYQVAGTNHVIVGVTWDEAVVREMLPPEVEPVADMSGGINIYEAKNAYGLGPYQSAYFWVNLEGVDSADGTKARWILQGVYGPEEKTSAALRTFLGSPVRNGVSRLEAIKDGTRAVGTLDGNDFVTVEIKAKPETCSGVAGTLNYLAANQASGEVAVSQIPYAGDWCEAEATNVKVTAPAGDSLGKLQPTNVLWAGEFKNGAFSFSRPLPLP